LSIVGPTLPRPFQVKSLAEGWERAAETIDSGCAGAKLAELADADTPG